MKLSFVVHGPPVPKARARVITDKLGTRGVTPAKTKAYEKHVGILALAARMRFEDGKPAWEHWPSKGKEVRFGIRVDVYHSRECDGDNVFKAIADACNGVLWADDRQICDGRFVKKKVERGEERVEIEAWVIG